MLIEKSGQQIAFSTWQQQRTVHRSRIMKHVVLCEQKTGDVSPPAA